MTPGLAFPRFRSWIVKIVPRKQGLAHLGVAVLLTVVTAMFGLVLAEAMPAGTTPRTFSATRLAVLIAVLGLLVAAVLYRRWVYRGTGTLFSVSFLECCCRSPRPGNTLRPAGDAPSSASATSWSWSRPRRVMAVRCPVPTCADWPTISPGTSRTSQPRPVPGNWWWLRAPASAPVTIHRFPRAPVGGVSCCEAE